MTKIRVFLILLTIIVVGTIGLFVSYYARGYRFNFKTLKFAPNGILVIKSDPTGAQVFINGDLRTATDANMPLSPGIYDLSIRKDGYINWDKRLTIEKEVVTEIDPSLFRSVPSLAPITFTGCANPVASPDYTKIVYAVLPGIGIGNDKIGLWVLETVNLPIGFAKDPRRITDGDLTGATWQFSPDGQQLLIFTKQGIFQINVGTFTPQTQWVNVASSYQKILTSWDTLRKEKISAQTRNLPPELVDILNRKSKAVVFSPDENKILYTASGSATLADNLIPQLPGSSTQKQDRDIKIGNTYVYDIKEDRNFLVYDQEVNLDGTLFQTQTTSSTSGQKTITNFVPNLSWFPTSRNLVLAEEGRITIIDYDGTNKQVVYSGVYTAPFAFPFASTAKLLLLTNLGADSSPTNLYSLTLK